MNRRISFDIPEEEFNRLNSLVPHGIKSYLMRQLISTLIKRLETDRESFLLDLYRHRLSTLALLEEELKRGNPERPKA